VRAQPRRYLQLAAKECLMTSVKPFRFGTGMIPVQGSADLADHARKVEALGYSTLGVGDHLSLGGIGPVASMMAFASATSSLRIASTVLTNDLRHPVLLAQEAATIDLLSDGRLELGIGGGWLRTDYDAVGLPFDSPAVRIARLEEAVALIKQLFGEEPVTFAGDFYRVERLNLQPKPRQRPHPPFFIGGGGRRVLALAAREATIVGLDPKGTAAGTKDAASMTAGVVDDLVALVREVAGPRFPDLELHVNILALKITDNRRQGRDDIATLFASMPPWMVSNALADEDIPDSPFVLVGSLDQIVEDLQARRERYGISYVSVPSELVDAFSPVVARLAGT
jgi:probable F420-dependent oxidoreductase